MKSFLQRIAAFVHNFFDGPAATTQPPALGELQEHDKTLTGAVSVKEDTCHKPWLVKLPVGVILEHWPDDQPWPDKSVLPKSITQMVFDPQGNADLTKLSELPLVSCMPSSLTGDHTSATFVYQKLQIERCGVKLDTKGNQHLLYKLYMVINVDNPDHPKYLQDAFALDYGVCAKLSEVCYTSGAVLYPMHFYLGVDETYRGYRSRSTPNPAEEDTYDVVLTVLDHGPSFYTKDSFIRHFNQQDSAFYRRYKGQRLLGEVQPQMSYRNTNSYAAMQEYMQINDDNVGFVVKDLWFEETPPIGYEGNQRPPMTVVMGTIKPVGPKASLVRAHLLDPAYSSHFGMRALVTHRNHLGQRVFDLHDIVTFDLVM